jgi:hypothetical protein
VRVRVSSGEITLGRLPEGTELVRIGRPVPRELATWRYGDQFGRRRRRNLIIGGTVAAVGGIAVAGGVYALGLGSYLAGSIAEGVRRTVMEGPDWMTVARLRAPDGSLLALKPKHLRATTFSRTRSGEPEVTIHFEHVSSLMGRDEPVTFTGAEAERALRSLLPAANRVGGTTDDIDLALARFTSAASPRQVVERIAKSRSNFTPLDTDSAWSRHLIGDGLRKQGLYAIPTGIALALEMAVSEEQERAAMEGDLAQLEDAWREAEEVARIADDLLLPGEVVGRFERLKRRVGERVAR